MKLRTFFFFFYITFFLLYFDDDFFRVWIFHGSIGSFDVRFNLTVRISLSHCEFYIHTAIPIVFNCESRDSVWDFRFAGGGNRAGAGEQCVDNGGANTWRERAVVENGFEGYLRWKIGCVAFVWWPGIAIFLC